MNNNTLSNTYVNKSLGYSLSYVRVAQRILNFILWYPEAFPTRSTISQGNISIKTVGRAIKQFKADGLFLINFNGIKRPSTYEIGPLVRSLEHKEYLLLILPELINVLSASNRFSQNMSLNSNNIQSQVSRSSSAYDCRAPKMDYNFWQYVLQRCVDVSQVSNGMFNVPRNVGIFINKQDEYSSVNISTGEYNA